MYYHSKRNMESESKLNTDQLSEQNNHLSVIHTACVTNLSEPADKDTEEKDKRKHDDDEVEEEHDRDRKKKKRV